MAKSLVIVESPTKVKTINKILGTKFKVLSSMGHLIDLPKSTLGIDVDGKFTPKWIVVRTKQKVLTQLKKAAKDCDTIYIATDPDREGEAIGWNIVGHLGEGKKVYRVTFQEITKEAVLRAFKDPREFDGKKVNAQVARRLLDRIVGYQISPLLWKKVGSRLSAGRVQSVALRLIVDRERAIRKFIPQEYWQITADLKKKGFADTLTANLERIKGEKPELTNKADTDAVVAKLQEQTFDVTDVTKKEVRRNPAPPFITSTMQQDAFNKLGFNASRTMMVAQQLYEGIELGDGEVVGLITYMRTDSVNVAKEALEAVRGFIGSSHGKKYLPDTPNVYKSKKSAQEAHEAVRPSDVLRRPEDVKAFLDSDQARLYELIWKRFVASQMTQAVFEQKKIEITAGEFQLGAAGSTLVFDGYLTLNRDVDEDETKIDFSHYQKNDRLDLEKLNPTQHFTKPPARFSEASLVKALEEDGIGRPSTYASIISTLVMRNYVLRERGYFMPTDLGMRICDLLVEYFARIMDVGFTAKMEDSLDQVEEGDLNYVQLLSDFYEPFKKELEFAGSNIERTEEKVDKTCPDCGRHMVVKWGRKGKFLSCSGFPECKFAQPFGTGVKCPQEGCAGELVRRRSSRGSFYGCSKYPQCTYTANDLPKTEAEGPAASESPAA